jgi:hypothetical protein
MFLALWLPKTLIIEHTSSKSISPAYIISSEKHDTGNKLTVEHFAATLVYNTTMLKLKVHIKAH